MKHVRRTMNSNRKGSSKKKGGKKTGDKTKLKKETAFLYFLAHNPHPLQTKKFLSSLLVPSQYSVLREVAVNELAGNLPETGKSSHKKKQKKDAKTAGRARLTKLAKGELVKSNLHHLADLIRILAEETLTYHDLCP